MKKPAIIVKRKRDGMVFARKIIMVKRYKHISDSDDHSDIDCSGSAEINAEDTLPDNRWSKTENVDSANNVRRSSHTRNPSVQFGKSYPRWKKTWRRGG